MFTGIIEETGTVLDRQESALTIGADIVMPGMQLGDSMAVNGACLTVVAFENDRFRVDLAPETLRRTALGQLEKGGSVNLERPVAVGGRLGGHIVQGHIDAAGRIGSIRPEGDCFIFRIRAPKRFMPYIVEKGFIAVDGISLTVVDKRDTAFTLSVIPYTLQNTNLRTKSANDRVNLEVDILAKYVESLLSR